MSASIQSDIGYYACCTECDWTSDLTTYADAALDADYHNDTHHNPGAI